MRIVALLYALSWVAVRAMLVCGCPASKGGVLRAISPAGRRFRASALVSGRKSHDVYAYIHVHLFLVVAFRDTRFLSGLSHRFSYIVCRGALGAATALSAAVPVGTPKQPQAATRVRPDLLDR